MECFQSIGLLDGFHCHFNYFLKHLSELDCYLKEEFETEFIDDKILKMNNFILIKKIIRYH